VRRITRAPFPIPSPPSTLSIPLVRPTKFSQRYSKPPIFKNLFHIPFPSYSVVFCWTFCLPLFFRSFPVLAPPPFLAPWYFNYPCLLRLGVPFGASGLCSDPFSSFPFLFSVGFFLPFPKCACDVGSYLVAKMSSSAFVEQTGTSIPPSANFGSSSLPCARLFCPLPPACQGVSPAAIYSQRQPRLDAFFFLPNTFFHIYSSALVAPLTQSIDLRKLASLFLLSPRRSFEVTS